MLSERRSRILNLVAEFYIRSAHPVPSSGIARWLEISSATVRNEFGALEDRGFLQQPHTSAGRVPTAKGFGAYARHFIPPQRLPARHRQIVSRRLSSVHGERLLREIANVAAELSSYAVVVTLPADDTIKAIEIHLSLLSSRRLLAVVILENGLVRQIGVELDPVPDIKTIGAAERQLRQLSLPIGIIPEALRGIATHAEPELARTLTAVAQSWSEVAPPRLFSQGLTNLLAEPESQDPDFVRVAVQQFESPPRTDRAKGGPLTVQFDDALAAITARLRFGTSWGTLTLLGPTRMRYPEALMIARGVSDAAMDNFPQRKIE
ncbi:MAG: hypothetical protein OXM87_08900 [Truepera sp.]|nr:hypothetical protein [Truepera sp.]